MIGPGHRVPTTVPGVQPPCSRLAPSARGVWSPCAASVNRPPWSTPAYADGPCRVVYKGAGDEGGGVPPSRAVKAPAAAVKCGRTLSGITGAEFSQPLPRLPQALDP